MRPRLRNKLQHFKSTFHDPAVRIQRGIKSLGRPTGLIFSLHQDDIAL